MNGDGDAVNHAIQILKHIEEEASFAFLAGDDSGFDGTLRQGSHEPEAVHIHMLATHMAALADVFDMDVHEVAKAGVEAHVRMEAAGTAVVAEDYSTQGGER